MNDDDDGDDDDKAIGITRYPVMPSLITLQQMRNRLHLAHLGRKLMKWTSQSTLRELRRIIIEIMTEYEGFKESIREAFILLARSRYCQPMMNKIVLENIPKTARFHVKTSTRSVAGVKIYVLEVIEDPFDPFSCLGLGLGGEVITQTRNVWADLLRKMIHIAELRRSFYDVDEANKNATKKMNVIKRILSPKLKLTIVYILSELEEREREETFRLKQFKKGKDKKKNKNDKCKICSCCRDKDSDTEKKKDRKNDKIITPFRQSGKKKETMNPISDSCNQDCRVNDKKRLNNLVTRIDEVIGLTKGCRQDGLVTKSMENFISTCCVAKEKIEDTGDVPLCNFCKEDIMKQRNAIKSSLSLKSVKSPDSIKTNRAKEASSKSMEKLKNPCCVAKEKIKDTRIAQLCKSCKEDMMNHRHAIQSPGSPKLVKSHDSIKTNRMNEGSSKSMENFKNPCCVAKEKIKDTTVAQLCKSCKEPIQSPGSPKSVKSHDSIKTNRVNEGQEVYNLTSESCEKYGYFEKKFKEIVKVTRLKNDDGTVSEEKQVITIRTERRNPKKPCHGRGSSSTLGPSPGGLGPGGHDGDNAKNFRSPRKSKSEHTCHSNNMGDPKLRKCTSCGFENSKNKKEASCSATSRTPSKASSQSPSKTLSQTPSKASSETSSKASSETPSKASSQKPSKTSSRPHSKAISRTFSNLSSSHNLNGKECKPCESTPSEVQQPSNTCSHGDAVSRKKSVYFQNTGTDAVWRDAQTCTESDKTNPSRYPNRVHSKVSCGRECKDPSPCSNFCPRPKPDSPAVSSDSCSSCGRETKKPVIRLVHKPPNGTCGTDGEAPKQTDREALKQTNGEAPKQTESIKDLLLRGSLIDVIKRLILSSPNKTTKPVDGKMLDNTKVALTEPAGGVTDNVTRFRLCESCISQLSDGPSATSSTSSCKKCQASIQSEEELKRSYSCSSHSTKSSASCKSLGVGSSSSQVSSYRPQRRGPCQPKTCQPFRSRPSEIEKTYSIQKSNSTGCEINKTLSKSHSHSTNPTGCGLCRQVSSTNKKTSFSTSQPDKIKSTSRQPKECCLEKTNKTPCNMSKKHDCMSTSFRCTSCKTIGVGPSASSTKTYKPSFRPDDKIQLSTSKLRFKTCQFETCQPDRPDPEVCGKSNKTPCGSGKKHDCSSKSFCKTCEIKTCEPASKPESSEIKSTSFKQFEPEVCGKSNKTPCGSGKKHDCSSKSFCKTCEIKTCEPASHLRSDQTPHSESKTTSSTPSPPQKHVGKTQDACTCTKKSDKFDVRTLRAIKHLQSTCSLKNHKIKCQCPTEPNLRKAKSLDENKCDYFKR